ncbi:MAG TPA: hypothetical protein ENN99_05635 [Chloroflexi bacterium]|nr:hypothetical protein [Chloroflexota bacterium]
MPDNLLRNGQFEADWGDEKSHRCLIIPDGGAPYEKDVGNIFTPPGWVTWFHHHPGTWDQPEVRDAWKQNDPRRVHSGQKGILLFTFFRKHDAGFLQQVQVAPGTRLRLTAWAHAWSNHKDPQHPDRFPNPDDGRWSEGAGYKAGFILEGETNDANWQNFTFYLGIDPTGGTNPLADTVVWGRGAHIYNEYAQVPAVEATAQADTVTVFLRDKTKWSFKHNDAYWDTASLVVVGEDGEDGEDGGDGESETVPEVRLAHRPASPQVGEKVVIEARSLTGLTNVALAVRQPSGVTLAQSPVVVGRDGEWRKWEYTTDPLSEAGVHQFTFTAADGVEATATFESTAAEQLVRGQPREQYQRTYVLLPPDAGADWALAVVDGTWDDRKYTIGSSADDAGIGDLNVRRVIAVNPRRWPSDLRAFFQEYYPGVEYTAVEAATPDELRQKIKRL